MAIVAAKRAGKKERIVRVVVLVAESKVTAQMIAKICPISNKEINQDRKMMQPVLDAERKVIANLNVQNW